MYTSFFTIALLSLSGALAAEKRQATDAAQFTSAADQLISKYIPSTALPALQAAVNSAASAASISGDPQSLLYSGLLASSAPGWFASAIPSAWSSQVAALGSDISALRGPQPTGAAAGAGAGAGAGGSSSVTVTTTTTSTAAPGSGSSGATGSPTSSDGGNVVGGVYSSLTTQVVSGVTSIFSTAVSKASGAGSTAVSGASSAGKSAASGASSVASAASSKAAGAMPTAVKGAAAGVAGLIGLMAAL